MPKKNLTIGCLLENIIEQYQYDIWEGIVHEAKKKNIGLICFPGRRIDTTLNFEYQSNILYKFPDKKNIHALIILTNTIGTNLTEKEMFKFCRSYYPIPVLSVGFKIPDIPSILINNEMGMQAILIHLIGEHRFSNFAFIRGPAGHQEANIRNQVITSFFNKNNIPLDNNLIESGDFQEDSGYLAMQKLLAKHKKIDVVVALNDQMAIGAIKALQNHGLHVPEDIAVVGFDDIPESRYYTPPLSTVHQPLFKLGKLALLNALALIHGREAPDVILPSYPVIRQSCGCFKSYMDIFKHSKKFYKSGSIFTDINLIKKNIFKEFKKVLKKTFFLSRDAYLQKNMSELIDRFLSDIKNASSKSFITHLNKLLNSNEITIDTISAWDCMLSLLRKNVLSYSLSRDILINLDEMCEQARILIIDAMHRSLGYRQLQSEKWTRKIAEIGNRLIITFDMEKLFELIIDTFKQLGIKQGYLSLYEKSQKYILSDSSKLLLAYEQGKSEWINIQGKVFKTQYLYPSGIFKNKNKQPFILLPLYFMDDQLGFIIIEMARELNPIVYDILNKQISSALKGSILMSEIKKHAHELEDKVAERTIELTKANQLLIRENQQRIKAEVSLNESKNYLRAITDAIPTPLLITRISDGKIVYYNTPFCTFLNISEDRIKALTLFDFFTDTKLIQELLEKLKDSNYLPNVELSIHTFSGSIVWVISTFKLFTFQGQKSIILAFYDITERKQLEKAISEIIEKEQRRIGQDLHDDICQKLAGISVMLSVLEEKLKLLRIEEAKTASYISELINDSIVQVKNIARGLYPVELERNSLSSVLENFSRKIQEQFGIQCIFNCNCWELFIDNFISLHLYRIAQEAVNNAIKHGEPEKIKIAFMSSKTRTSLIIIDDGKGLPDDININEGIGMRIMNYRANLIGAKLTIKPNRKRGTNLSCIIKNRS